MIVQCKGCGKEYFLNELVSAGVGVVRAYAVKERYLVISSAFRCLQCGAGMFYAAVDPLGHKINSERVSQELQGFFTQWEQSGQGHTLSVRALERFHTEVVKIIERGVPAN